MLLNGDGQLHECDWAGMGEDGEYEMGEGDDPHNDSFKSMSRSNSRNSLSGAAGRSPAPSASGRGVGGRGGAHNPTEALNEHVMSLEEENVSLRALTRSLMNERHELLTTLDNTAGQVVHLRRVCASLQSKLMAAGVKPQGPALGPLDPEAGFEGHAEHHRSLAQQPHHHHHQSQQPMHQAQRGHAHQQPGSNFQSEHRQQRPDHFEQQQQQHRQQQQARQQPPAPIGLHATSGGGYGSAFRSPAAGGINFEQHSPAFGQIQSSPGFGKGVSYLALFLPGSFHLTCASAAA